MGIDLTVVTLTFDDGTLRWFNSSPPVERGFCGTCGSTLFSRSEHSPEMTGVSAGCFADPDFPQPEFLVWSKRRHGWLGFPENVAFFDEEPEGQAR